MPLCSNFFPGLSDTTAVPSRFSPSLEAEPTRAHSQGAAMEGSTEGSLQDVSSLSVRRVSIRKERQSPDCTSRSNGSVGMWPTRLKEFSCPTKNNDWPRLR
eukprot:GHVT01013854.1.p2 GENE.GHVT01013854.1~~GHVT01013854.1.p2  ORF type:complete len:101 (+),score=9.99 GHVT01013854.1:711-1013(+)